MRNVKSSLALFPLVVACLIGMAAAAPAAQAQQAPWCELPWVSPPAPLQSGDFLHYAIGNAVEDAELCYMGTAQESGAVVLEGNPTILWRHDVFNANTWAGIFQVTKAEGDVRIRAHVTVGFDETATIISGRVKIGRLDGNGNVVEYKEYSAGDTYFIPAGTTVEWLQTVKTVQKSFHDSM